MCMDWTHEDNQLQLFMFEVGPEKNPVLSTYLMRTSKFECPEFEQQCFSILAETALRFTSKVDDGQIGEVTGNPTDTPTHAISSSS